MALTMGMATLRAADQRDPLDRARALYNQQQFAAAIAAADDARRVAAHADSADLIAARALLERYRTSGDPDDLLRARLRLRGLNAARFSSRERIELMVGLGETLYFERVPGAAAGLFESALVARDAPSWVR